MNLKVRVFPVATTLLAFVAWLIFPGRVCAYQTETVQNGGTIVGTVKFAGLPPPREAIQITKDRDVCGATAHYDQSLIVGKNGGIANAVVSIAGIEKGAPLVALKHVKFDQKGCEYVPHVLAFPAGSTVDIINSDGILHSIRTDSKRNPPLDMAQPGFKKVITVSVENAELIEVSCDTHNWMRGWWFVAGNPYYSVTDAQGRFVLKDVPPGAYTLQVWQEKLGVETRKVTVEPNKTVTVDFTMAPKK
jgi:Carboxypeptidase regulatory-like domain